MKKTLVGITTDGTRKEIFKVIQNIRESLARAGLKPVFSIASEREFEDLEDIICMPVKEFDYTQNILKAIDKGVEKFRPDYIATLGDDFEGAAEHIDSILKPAMEGGVSFGNWGPLAGTYAKMRYASFLFASRVANACKGIEPSMECTYNFDRDFGDLVQVYSGVFAFSAKDWANVRKRMKEIFGKDTLGWALEAAVLMTCFNLRLPVVTSFCHQGNEANQPVRGEKETRVQQLRDAFECANAYLGHTKQYDILRKVKRFEGKMIDAVESLA